LYEKYDNGVEEERRKSSGGSVEVRTQELPSVPAASSTGAQEHSETSIPASSLPVAPDTVTPTPGASAEGASSSTTGVHNATSASHVEAPTNEERRGDAEEEPGAIAHRTLDEADAQRICNLTIADIARYPHPPDFRIHCLGTWMVWMVHRVFLNDPSVQELDFKRCSMPSARDEPRIAPKLLRALRSNTHLRVLKLECANLEGEDQARELAESLRANRTLEVLNLESNCFTPSDLEVIFSSLAHNTAMKEIRLQAQLGDEQAEAPAEQTPGFRTIASQADISLLSVVHQTMRTNHTLQKLGLYLTDCHYRNEITRALIRNTEITRRSKSASRRASKEEQRSKDMTDQDRLRRAEWIRECESRSPRGGA
jgi:hypothetical protein